MSRSPINFWPLFIITGVSLFWTACSPVPIVAADQADSWRQFRGDRGDGLAIGQSLPTEWSEQKNVRWKTPVHGRGWSSPVVADGEIWLTTATEDGLKMYVMCFDLQDGSIKHDQLVFENTRVQPDFHVTNTYASPTPVLEGDRVYVHFGAYGTACLRREDCSVIWQRRDLPCNHYRGPGSSPIIYQHLLIFHMDGFDFQYAVALNKETGETVWKKTRDVEYGTDNGDLFKAFSTPLVISVNGRDQLVSPASMSCVVLNPLTGEEFWRVGYEEHSTTVRPLFDGEKLFLGTGFPRSKMMCVRVSGQPELLRGDVTETHVEWIQKQNIGSKPSPILVGNRLFEVTDNGILERIDTRTGEIVWNKRLEGNFSASLVANGEQFLAFNHQGQGYVFTVEDEPQLLGENTLDAGCNASPAIVDNSLIVRTTTHLYRLQQP